MLPSLPSPRRRSAVVVLGSLLALASASLIQPTSVGAAAAASTVLVTDPTGDTARGITPVAETTADITAVSARYQNDHINLTMKLVKGAEPRAEDVMRWAIGARPDASPAFIVDFKKGTSGFGQAVVSVPGGDPIDCPGTSASFDVATGIYMRPSPPPASDRQPRSSGTACDRSTRQSAAQTKAIRSTTLRRTPASLAR